MINGKSSSEILTLIKKIDGLNLIFPMLSSDSISEAGNAAHIITKKLKQSSLDWHDIVKVLFENSSIKKENTVKVNNAYWKTVERSGNYFANINGIKCTIFRSKRNNGFWDLVMNTDDGPIFYNGFPTVEEAQDKVYEEIINY